MSRYIEEVLRAIEGDICSIKNKLDQLLESKQPRDRSDKEKAIKDCLQENTGVSRTKVRFATHKVK